MRVGVLIITCYVLYNMIYSDTMHRYCTITHRVVSKARIRKKEFMQRRKTIGKSKSFLLFFEKRTLIMHVKRNVLKT